MRYFVLTLAFNITYLCPTSVYADDLPRENNLYNSSEEFENNNDVRCYSSVVKVQSFIAGLPLSEQAVAARVDGLTYYLNQLLQHAYRRQKKTNPKAQTISFAALSQAIASEQPAYRGAETSRTIKLQRNINVPLADLTDYRNSGEQFRLLQSWHARYALEWGQEGEVPELTDTARAYLQDFLLTYDIAVLKNARQIASEDKQSEIGAEHITKSMNVS